MKKFKNTESANLWTVVYCKVGNTSLRLPHTVDGRGWTVEDELGLFNNLPEPDGSVPASDCDRSLSGSSVDSCDFVLQKKRRIL